MPDVLSEARKRRGPFTWVVIALVVAWWLLGLTRMVLATVGGLHPLEAASRYGQDLVSVPVILVLLLLAVADVWVKPRLENAVRLTSVATWVSSAAVGTSILASIVGLWSPVLKSSERALSIADIIVSSVVPVLLCVVLGMVARAAGRARAEDGTGPEPAAAAATGRAGNAVGGSGAGEPGAGEPGPGGTVGSGGSVPVWEPDAAAGAAWTSAVDAAHGQQASAWGDTSTPFGWDPDRALESGGPAGSEGRVPENGTDPSGGSAGAAPEASGRPGPGPGQIDPDLWRTPRNDPQ